MTRKKKTPVKKNGIPKNSILTQYQRLRID